MYLDAKGLVALWREGLLAQKVLQGKTQGYRKHPQLMRFKEAQNPLLAIACYLHAVADEADNRQYHFQRDKIINPFSDIRLSVNKGQLAYEWTHLLKKLKNRNPQRFELFCTQKNFQAHPMFDVIEGKVADWEVVDSFFPP